MGPSARFAAFGVPAFRTYFVAQFVAQASTWFQTLTVALAIAERTGSAFALSGTMIAQFAPTLLFSWVAGRACDRWSARRIAIAATLLVAATGPALIAVLTREDLSLPWLYAVLAVGGAGSTFARIASQSLVYELVGPTLLQNAAIWASMVASAGRVVGPGLAGASLALLGTTPTLVINAILGTAAALTLAAIRESQLIPRRADPGTPETARIRLPRSTGVLLVLNTGTTLLAMNLLVTLTAIVTFDFEGDGMALGLTHVLTAVGAVLATSLITRVRHITATTAAFSIAVLGLTQLLVASAPVLALMLAFTAVLGIGIGLYQSSLAAAVQTSTPPAALGRAMSLVTLGTFGTLPIGALLIGASVEFLGARPTFALCGCACLVLATTALTVLRTRWAREEPRQS